MSTISNDEVAIKIQVDAQSAEVTLLKINENLTKLVNTADKATDSTSNGLTSSFIELNQALELGKKALSILGDSLGYVLDLAERGEAVSSLKEGFENLGGVESTITKASDAVLGLVSNTDLLQLANQAMIAGVPDVNQNFELLASTAGKLANTLNIDTADALSQLVNGLGKAQDKQLQLLGINVDSTAVNEAYALSIGKEVKELTELEKKQAFQIEALEQIKKKNEELAPVTDSVGNAVTRLKNSMQQQYDQSAVLLNGNQDLIASLNGLTQELGKVDFQSFIGGLAEVATFLTTTFTASLIEAQKALVVFGGLLSSDNQLGFYIKNIEGINQLTASQKELKTTAEQLAKLGIEPLTKGLAGLETQIDETRANAKKLQDQGLTDSKLYKEQIRELERLRMAQGFYSTELEQLTATKKEANKVTGTGTGITEEEKKKLQELGQVLSGQTNTALNVFKSQLEDLVKLNPDQDINVLATSLTNVAAEGIKAGGSLEEISKIIDEVNSKKQDGGILGSIFGKIDGNLSEVQKGIDQAIGESLKGSIDNILNNLDGGSIRDGLSGVIGDLGSSISSSLGVPIIGDVLFDELGKNIAGIGKDTASSIKGLISAVFPPFVVATKLFGDDISNILNKAFSGKSNAAANAREAVESIFNDAIKQAKEMGLVLEANFSDFGRDAFDPFLNAAGETVNQMDELFANLSSDAQGYFTDIGIGLEQILNVPELEDGQLGYLLAANFGQGINSLNDLQLLMQSMGLTADQMAEQITSAWLKGDLSAQEYIRTLDATKDLMAEGIPGAIGATNEAFQNYVEGGLQSGLKAYDALKDISAEAAEAVDANGNRTINSLDDLKKSLIAGGASAKDVELYFAELSKNGIDSIEALGGITEEQAGRITAGLQASGFAFVETTEKVKELKKELDEVRSKSVDIELNVRTNFDKNTESLNENISNGNSTVSGISERGQAFA